MGLRFRKSMKIAPGVRLNLNKKSTGLTLGGKGFHYTVNSNGRKTASVGIPGSGLYYSETINKKKTKKDYENIEEGAMKMKDKKSKKGCLPIAVISLLILGIVSSCVGDVDETATTTLPDPITTVTQSDSTTVPYTTALTTTELVIAETNVEETSSSTTEKPTETEKATTTTKKATTTKKVTTTKKANKNNSQKIYRTETGKRYHYENPCGNGSYYEVSYDDAIASGLTPCQKCVQ